MPKPHTAKHVREHAKKTRKPDSDHPPPEEDLGGGDFCSPEQSPPTDDDRPLD